MQVGLDKKRWAFVRDRYLSQNFLTPEDYEALNRDQKMVINEIKKAFKNIKENYEATDEETNYDFDEESTRLGSENPPY